MTGINHGQGAEFIHLSALSNGHKSEEDGNPEAEHEKVLIVI